MILKSGPCADSLAFLKFYLAGLERPALRALLLALRVKFSPDILEKIRRCALPMEEKAALFSKTMTLFKSGSAYKTTAPGRSPLTDGAILAEAKPGDLIVETGVSDGISALTLLENAKNAEVVLTDSQDCFLYRNFCCGRIFYTRDDLGISVKLPFFYFCTGLKAEKLPADGREISLLNPLVWEKSKEIKIIPFDVFSGTLDRKADIIKCANVLNLDYFSPHEIKQALANLLENLKDTGRIFVTQNNKKYKDGEAYLVLRKQNGRMTLAVEVNGHELLAHLKTPLFTDLLDAPGNRGSALWP